MESWSSKFSVWEVKEIQENRNEITCLGQDHFVEGLWSKSARIRK